MKSKLTGAEEQKIAKNYTTSTEAYQLYLRGRYHWNKRTPTEIRQSVDYYQQAIDKDPTYALAYASMAEAYNLFVLYQLATPREAFAKAKAAALKAIEIDGTLAEGHNALAKVESNYDWNFSEAEAEWQRAISLNPNYATAHQWYGEHLSEMGRYDEAIAELKRAEELDPLSLIINAVLGLIYGDSGQPDQAIQQLRKTIEMDPNFMPAHFFLASQYARVGMFKEAADEYGKAIIITGGSNEVTSKYLAVLKDAYKASGPKGYWRTLAELTETTPTQAPIRPATVAGIWAQAGETDKAFALLEEGYTQRDEEMLRLKNWIFDPIKSDPRYKDLLRRVGLPQN